MCACVYVNACLKIVCVGLYVYIYMRDYLSACVWWMCASFLCVYVCELEVYSHDDDDDDEGRG